MRTLWRTAGPALVRDVGALAAAAGVIGVSFGAIGAAAGLPLWAMVAMSLVVFAGGSQFMAVGMLAAGNPLAAVVGGLLLNARHLPFGFAVAPAVGVSRPARLFGSHLMTDESVAFALAQTDPNRRRAAYWLTGIALFGVWNLGTVVGGVLGGIVADPALIGLDAVFPAALLALLLPGLRDPAARRVAALGAVVAVLTTPFLPAGVPVLLAMVGLLVAGRRAAEDRGPAPAEDPVP